MDTNKTRTPIFAVLLFVVTTIGCGNGDADGLVGNDGDAETSVQSVEFVDITGTEQCGSVDNGGTLKLQFRGENDTLLTGSSGLTIDDIDFDAARFYAIPDVDCAGDASACPDGFSCEPSPDGIDRCVLDTELSATSSPDFAGLRPASQAFGVAVADVGRWEGRHHPDFGGLFEFNEDGDNRELMQPNDETVAVDSGGQRIHALRDLASTWGQLSDHVKEEGRDAYFGHWLFGDSSQEVSPQLFDVTWTQEADIAANVIQNHQLREGRAGVYNSMIRIIEDAYADDPTISGVEDKHLLFLVAGYDERRQNRVQDVIHIANTYDVRVSVVHVDAAVTVPENLRDDEHYYLDQYGSPCVSSNECANYETCREPIAYTNLATTDDPEDILWPDPQLHSPGDSYCLPDYDRYGRVGPIEDYRRLACETGGIYAYVPEAGRTAIAEPLISALLATEAAWEIDIDFTQAPPSPGAYLLETVMNLPGDVSLPLVLGDHSRPDSRPALFLGN